MGQSALGSDHLRTLLVLLALLAAALAGIFLQSRTEWRMLRRRLFRPREGLEKLSRPSRVEERLASGRWEAAFRATLERARRDFDGDGGAAAALRAVENGGEELESMVKEIASNAMTLGDLRSALVRLDEVLVYFLIFPGRYEDRRTLRCHKGLSDGWPAHAARIRAAAGAGRAPMIALLYFLGREARDGALLVAYEGDDGRRFPAELAEPLGGACGGPTLSYDFALV